MLQIQRRLNPDSSPSPAPRNYLSRRGFVQDYMDQADDITQFEEQSQPEQDIPDTYCDPAEKFGLPGSKLDYYQFDTASAGLNTDKQAFDAYMTYSGSQNHLQGLPAHPSSALTSFPDRGSNPRNSHGIPLKPVSTLPDIYRSLFKFGVFNAIQSRCYDSIMNADDNIIVSAPTGSGKTVLFELALVRLLMEKNPHAKCVYMAPTKALCSERRRDWMAKLDPIGIKCCELTGDTVGFGRNAWGDAKSSSVIITTPEKFDSLSRNWRDHGDILSQTRLLLIDEVHILNESRGSTLEVVTSRMKANGTSVRFLLVSATVPNIDDIAEWIGNGISYGPATVFKFGDEFRPCKLTRVVYGYPRKGQNDFSFSRTLDYKLFPLLQKHSADKPVLVFCATRKGVVRTAQVLVKEYQNLVEAKQTVPWAQPRRIDAIFQDSQLQEFATAGIGVHHAGLTLDDRRVTEDLFLKKVIRVVVATSTLAVGVNLPAHTVVVKGVRMWMNGEWQEYSDLDFIQMIGRAGRPQFDKEGVAVILCDTDQERKYKALISGQTLLESCLHVNLSEHLNSEIGLNTITNLRTAKEWLHNSFLFQRIQKNPRHYALNKAADQTWQSRLDELVESSINSLQRNELVTDNRDNGNFTSTEYGEIMSKYYIRLSTMVEILKLPEESTLRDILEMIASAEEIDLRLRAGEKQIYKRINDHNDIRFRTKVEKPRDKVFILVQAVLGGISLSSPEYKTFDSQPYLEALTVFKHAARIARTIVEVAIVKKYGAILKHGMELVRSLTAKTWEDRPMVLRQIEQIGDKSIKVLAENGIATLASLRREKPARIESLVNRRPPFGNLVLAAARDMPQFTLKITETSVSSFQGKRPVMIEMNIECGLASVSETNGTITKGKKSKTITLGMTSILTLTSDNDFVDFRRIPTKALRDPRSFTVRVQLTKPSQTVITRISPDNFAGLTVTETYRPSVEPEEYPTRDTRPANYDVDAVLAGLEDDPTFWQVADSDLPGDQIGYASNVTSTPQPKNKDKAKSMSAQKFDKQFKASLDDPVKLWNGNYECLHTCKDKGKCRHLCCREGLAKPPKKPCHPATSGSTHAGRTSLARVSKDGFLHIVPSEDDAKAKQKTKKLPVSDNDFRHLETLHQRTGGLELPAGRRLKLDSNDTVTSRKADKIWSVDLTFTDIEQTVKPSAVVTGGEDLPDPHDFLSRQLPKSCHASGTQHLADHNPGLESKHRDFVSFRSAKKAQETSVTHTARLRHRSKTPPSRLPSPLSKRQRLDGSLTASSAANASKQLNLASSSDVAKSYPADLVQSKLPLFLEGAFGSDVQDNIDEVMHDDNQAFTFDPSTFDMEPTSFTPVTYQSLVPSSTILSMDGSLVETKHPWPNGQNELDDVFLVDQICAQLVETEKPSEDEARVDDYAQGLAEFEAWLQSGAVEITEEGV